MLLEKHVDRLETMFEHFLLNNDRTLRRLENLLSDMRRQADKDREQMQQILQLRSPKRSFVRTKLRFGLLELNSWT